MLTSSKSLGVITINVRSDDGSNKQLPSHTAIIPPTASQNLIMKGEPGQHFGSILQQFSSYLRAGCKPIMHCL